VRTKKPFAPSSSGDPLHRSTLYKQGYLPAIRRSGVPRIRFHNLRHTYASLLIAQGEQPKYIQEQMGHSSIKVTFDVYGHLMEKVNVRSANRLAMTVFGEDRGGSSSETVADSEKRERGTGNLLN
jgi:integrase